MSDSLHNRHFDQGILRHVMAHRKPTLPEKICLACHRPMAWRKRWRANWDSVRYCSERCRRTVGGSGAGAGS